MTADWLPLEALTIESMACGWQSLFLTEEVGWEGLPLYAAALANLLGGELGDDVCGPDVRLNAITIDGNSYWVAYDDWFPGASLEPRTPEAAAAILQLYMRLRRRWCETD